MAERRPNCYNPSMNTKPTLFDRIDPVREAQADERAEEDIREGRLINHEVVRHWLSSWVEGSPVPRPRIGD
jgi:predicted transcriptional regulator